MVTFQSNSFQLKRKALYDYFFCIVVSTGPSAQDTSDNSVIIGAGFGAGVICISIVVIGVLLFISRKRQVNRRNGNVYLEATHL